MLSRGRRSQQAVYEVVQVELEPHARSNWQALLAARIDRSIQAVRGRKNQERVCARSRSWTTVAVLLYDIGRRVDGRSLVLGRESCFEYQVDVRYHVRHTLVFFASTFAPRYWPLARMATRSLRQLHTTT